MHRRYPRRLIGAWPVPGHERGYGRARSLREPDKARRVGEWLREIAEAGHDIVVSTQVMIELRSVLMRRFTPPLNHADAQRALDALAAFEVVACDHNLVLDAHVLAEREQLSWFDALIVEAAIRSDCAVLFSEDLPDGRRYGGLEVRNPLRDRAGP
jgi:predicted nucleic acid-binding protein